MIFLMILLAPALEIFAFVQSARTFGGWETLGWTIAATLWGWTLVKRALIQPDSADRLTENMGRLIGGFLLLAPGLISDAFGLLILFPPTRALIFFFMQIKLRRWLDQGFVRFRVQNIRFDSMQKSSDFRDVTNSEIVDIVPIESLRIQNSQESADSRSSELS